MGPSIRSGPLAISAFEAEQNSFVFTWVSRPGTTYVLETSTVLGNWEELAAHGPAFGFKTTLQVTITQLARTQFFRIRESD